MIEHVTELRVGHGLRRVVLRAGHEVRADASEVPALLVRVIGEQAALSEEEAEELKAAVDEALAQLREQRPPRRRGRRGER